MKGPRRENSEGLFTFKKKNFSKVEGPLLERKNWKRKKKERDGRVTN